MGSLRHTRHIRCRICGSRFQIADVTVTFGSAVQANRARIPSPAMCAISGEAWTHVNAASVPAWRDKLDEWSSSSEAAADGLQADGVNPEDFGGDLSFEHGYGDERISPSQFRAWAEQGYRLPGIPRAPGAVDVPHVRTTRRFCRVKRSGGASQPRSGPVPRFTPSRAAGGDAQQCLPR